VFLFAGFLVSIETFRQVRIPFTSILVGARRTEHGPLADDGTPAATGVPDAPADGAAATAPPRAGVSH
jgi:hypothetical protein